MYKVMPGENGDPIWVNVNGVPYAKITATMVKAWDHFTHDHARSRTYRWGEDGIDGFSDDNQQLCLGLALWNGQDTILKERLFGLTNAQGNHGEDVKELYYYLDATPSHSYLKILYKYPQLAFPYSELIEENSRRGKTDPEYELLDTGLFDDNQYFDVFVEYAKSDADDILMRITAYNRASQPAPLHILPQLWCRNTWSWGYDATRPSLSASEAHSISIAHDKLGDYYCYFDGTAELLFCDNDTNTPKLYAKKTPGYFKDGFHEAVINGQQQAVNPDQQGTKACGHYTFTVPANEKVEVRLRLSKKKHKQAFSDFEQIFASRLQEANAFYTQLQKELADDEARMIQRQAFAGMIWSKQFYYYLKFRGSFIA
jgi:hypothetical protein